MLKLLSEEPVGHAATDFKCFFERIFKLCFADVASQEIHSCFCVFFIDEIFIMNQFKRDANLSCIDESS